MQVFIVGVEMINGLQDSGNVIALRYIMFDLFGAAWQPIDKSNRASFKSWLHP